MDVRSARAYLMTVVTRLALAQRFLDALPAGDGAARTQVLADDVGFWVTAAAVSRRASDSGHCLHSELCIPNSESSGTSGLFGGTTDVPRLPEMTALM